MHNIILVIRKLVIDAELNELLLTRSNIFLSKYYWELIEVAVEIVPTSLQDLFSVNF